MASKRRISIWKAYGFAWITGGLFLFTLIGHWLFGWFAYVNEQQAHAQPIVVADYLVKYPGRYEGPSLE